MLLCGQHTEERHAEDLDERWEQFGPEAYVTYLEDARDDVWGDVWGLYRGQNPVAEEVGARVAAFLGAER